MLTNIPDVVKQRFRYSVEEARSRLECDHIFDDNKDQEYSAKFLSYSDGRPTQYVALFNKNVVSVHFSASSHNGDVVCRHVFRGKHLVVQDVEYLPSEDGDFGLAVAVNSDDLEEDSFIALLTNKERHYAQVIRKVKIPHEITCLKVLICDQRMSSKIGGLNTRFGTWSHILAVGTHNAHCYLTSFQNIDPTRRQPADYDTVVSSGLTDGLKPFCRGGMFVYDTSGNNGGDGRKLDLKMPIDGVSVSAIGYVERHRTVLIGLSFGGIMTVSLTKTPNINCLLYCSSTAVNFFAYMEPDDDPRFHVWFLVAHAASETDDKKGTVLALYEGFCGEEEDLPLHSRTFENAVYHVQLKHMVTNRGTRWISMRTLVREKYFEGNHPGSQIGDTTFETLNRSHPDSDKSCAIVFFTYVDRNGKLMGGMFDLNAYYYKRLVKQITTDSTIARQNAFLSVVYPPASREMPPAKHIRDISILPSEIFRFVSNACDADQLFYPSAFNVPRIHVAFGSFCASMSLPSLQNQLLTYLYDQVKDCLVDPAHNSMADGIRGIGLVSQHTELTMENIESDAYISSELTVVICALLHFRPTSWRVLARAVRDIDSAELLNQLAKITWKEVETAKERVDDTNNQLFTRCATSVAPAGRKSLSHALIVFQAASIVTKGLIEKAKEMNFPKEESARFAVMHCAVSNLVEYTQCVFNFLELKLIPMTNEVRETRADMKRKITKRRLNAEEHGKMLYVDKLVSQMQRQAPGEAFWLGQTPQQWYPPALQNLLAPILLTTFSEKVKRSLLVYYMLDQLTCDAQHADKLQEKPESVIGLVEAALFNVLSIEPSNGKVEVEYGEWLADADVTTPVSSKNEPIVPALVKLSGNEQDQKDFDRLLRLPRKPTQIEESKMKDLSKLLPYGQYAYACHLIKRERYDEVPELEAIDDDNKYVAEYKRMIPLVMRLRKQLPAVRDVDRTKTSYDSRWSDNILCAIKNFEPAPKVQSKGSSNPILFVPKTPIPLKNPENRKRQATLSECTIESQSTPPAKRSLEFLLEIAGSPNAEHDLVSEQAMHRINSVLRTPMRVARAAAMAEEQISMQTTPEDNKQMVPPASILKKQGQQSPSRPRLRFAPDVLPSADSPLARIPLNFDDDSDFEEINVGTSQPSASDFLKDTVNENVDEAPNTTLDAMVYDDKQDTDEDDEEHKNDDADDILEENSIDLLNDSETAGCSLTTRFEVQPDAADEVLKSSFESQPDDEEDGEIVSEPLETSIEIQPDTDDDEESIADTSRTVVVEPATRVGEDADMVIESNDNVLCQGSAPLVDYTLNDSTFFTTPIRERGEYTGGFDTPIGDILLSDPAPSQQVSLSPNVSNVSLNSSTGIVGTDGVTRFYEQQPDEAEDEMEQEHKQKEVLHNITEVVIVDSIESASGEVMDTEPNVNETFDVYTDAIENQNSVETNDAIPVEPACEDLNQTITLDVDAHLQEENAEGTFDSQANDASIVDVTPVVEERTPSSSDHVSPTPSRHQTPVPEVEPVVLVVAKTPNKSTKAAPEPDSPSRTTRRSVSRSASAQPDPLVMPVITTRRRSVSRTITAEIPEVVDVHPTSQKNSTRRSVSRSSKTTEDAMTVPVPQSPSRSSSRNKSRSASVTNAPADDLQPSAPTSKPVGPNGKPLRGAAMFKWLLDNPDYIAAKNSTSTSVSGRKRTVSDTVAVAPTPKATAVMGIIEEKHEQDSFNRRRSRSATRRIAPTTPKVDVSATPAKTTRSASRSKKADERNTELPTPATPTRRSSSRKAASPARAPPAPATVSRRSSSRTAASPARTDPAPATTTSRSSSRSAASPARTAATEPAAPAATRRRSVSRNGASSAKKPESAASSKLPIPIKAPAKRTRTTSSQSSSSTDFLTGEPLIVRSRRGVKAASVDPVKVGRQPISADALEPLPKRKASDSSVLLPPTASNTPASASRRRKATVERIDE